MKCCPTAFCGEIWIRLVLFEEQRERFVVSHLSGDEQRRPSSFCVLKIWIRTGFKENSGDVHLPVTDGVLERGVSTELIIEVGAFRNKLSHQRLIAGLCRVEQCLPVFPG